MISAHMWNKLLPHLNCAASLPCKVRFCENSHCGTYFLLTIKISLFWLILIL